ncbi:hypothetical protein ACFQ2B_24450 [Streptomyces stramineus]|uniref:Uncharacterized protein n=1 Tax=Streptomyces stramineus TaxID=173861 RepID=A0ABP3L9E2_9ACTN
MSEREVGYEEFLAPGRDEEQARDVHRALRRMADGSAGEVLREMAREVLSGRTGLREAMRVGAYADALADGVQGARREWERLPAADRERLTAEARRLPGTQW